MASMTLKNIPAPLLSKVRAAAQAERRSVAQEFLVLVTRGLESSQGDTAASSSEKAARVKAWTQLLGTWQSDESPEEQGRRLVRARTKGRKVEL